MARAKATTDHETIRRWAESRGGHPAIVKGTGNGEPPILRIDFPGYSGEDTLEEISWNEFFDYFEKANLAFLYQDEPNSRFFKLVDRETVSGRGRRRQTRRSSARQRGRQARARGRASGSGRATSGARKTAAQGRQGKSRGRKPAGQGRSARGQGRGGRKKRQAR